MYRHLSDVSRNAKPPVPVVRTDDPSLPKIAEAKTECLPV